MAQDADQDTSADISVERSLDDKLHRVHKKEGRGINDAIRNIERRISTGQLLLLRQEYVDGKPNGYAYLIKSYNFSINYELKLDMDGHLRAVPRTLTAGGTWWMPGGITAVTNISGEFVPITGLPTDDFQHAAEGFEYFVVEPSPATQAAPVQQPSKIGADPNKFTDTGAWIAAEAVQMKKAGEIPEGIRITNFAKLLEERMREAAKTDDSIRPVRWEHIRNTLSTWGLWPIEFIKIS